MLRPIPVIYIVILLLLATLPINGQDTTDSILNNNYTLYIRWDYLLHAIVYLPMFPLLSFNKAKEQTIKIILVSIVLGVLLEAVQLLVPWRTFNINDLVSNILGIGIGFVFWRIARKTVEDFFLNK